MMQTKTYTQADLFNLAAKAPNAHVGAAILSGTMATIKDGDVLWTRPGLNVEKHLAAPVGVQSFGTPSPMFGQGIVTKTVDTAAPAPIVAKELERTPTTTPTAAELEKARLDPTVTPAQFRAMVGLPPKSATPAPTPEPAPAPTPAQIKAARTQSFNELWFGSNEAKSADDSDDSVLDVYVGKRNAAVAHQRAEVAGQPRTEPDSIRRGVDAFNALGDAEEV